MSNRGFYVAAALFLAAVGIFYIWDRGQTPVSPTGTPSPSPLAAPVIDVAASDITQVVVKSKEKVLTVAGAGQGFTYSLCSVAEASASPVAPACAAQPADPNRAATAFSSMAGLRPTTTAFGGASRLGDFGLDQPTAEITVKAKQGTYVLQVGGRTPDSAGVYVRKADGQDVYVITAAVLEGQVLAQLEKPPVPVPTPSPVAAPSAPVPQPS